MEGWHPAPNFAEEAEALGMTTNQIAAVSDNAKVVTYTLNETNDPDEPVFAAVLVRGYEDRILFAWLAGIPVGTLGPMRNAAFGRYGPPPGDPT